MSNPNNIFFYDSDQPYYSLTNMYEKSPIVINGIIYKTPSHYYYWNKFTDPIVKQRILNAPTANMVANISSQNKYLVIPNFNIDNSNDSNDNDIMLRALRAKFMQYPQLLRELKSTNENPLIFHSEHDKYWADGGDGTGENILGKLLMQIRNELR